MQSWVDDGDARYKRGSSILCREWARVTEKCLEIVDAVASTDVLLNPLPPRREEGTVLIKSTFLKWIFMSFKDKFAGFNAKARYLKQEILILGYFYTV